MTTSERTARLVYTVEEAAEVLGIGRGLAYEQARCFLASGGRTGIPTVRIGKRYVVPVDALRRFLEVLEGDGTAA